MSFYQLSVVFCKPYDSSTAATDLGLPLRTSGDVLQVYPRANLLDTYDLVFRDLKASIHDLPQISNYKTRPSKAASYALLSRIYLSIGDYDNALKYADSTLAIYDDLLDYNTLNSTDPLPFAIFNTDVLFHASLSPNGLLRVSGCAVDTILYKEYEENDLRKSLFFRQGTGGLTLFKGTYTASSLEHFGGIAIDEVYLNRAECYARKADVTSAMKDLNTLLRTRWRIGTYVEKTAEDADDALRKVLSERRKELIFRGLRWADIRRLNKDARFAKTLVRKINGNTYQLPPGDPRYTYPIPDDEINVSGIQQNVR
jgi:tetratricopeptide (TPR) repeat protein